MRLLLPSRRGISRILIPTFFFRKQEKFALDDKRHFSDPSPLLGSACAPEAVSATMPRKSLPDMVISLITSLSLSGRHA